SIGQHAHARHGGKLVEKLNFGGCITIPLADQQHDLEIFVARQVADRLNARFDKPFGASRCNQYADARLRPGNRVGNLITTACSRCDGRAHADARQVLFDRAPSCIAAGGVRFSLSGCAITPMIEHAGEMSYLPWSHRLRTPQHQIIALAFLAIATKAANLLKQALSKYAELAKRIA